MEQRGIVGEHPACPTRLYFPRLPSAQFAQSRACPIGLFDEEAEAIAYSIISHQASWPLALQISHCEKQRPSLGSVTRFQSREQQHATLELRLCRPMMNHMDNALHNGLHFSVSTLGQGSVFSWLPVNAEHEEYSTSNNTSWPSRRQPIAEPRTVAR